MKVSVEELNCASNLLMMLMEFRNFGATGQARLDAPVGGATRGCRWAAGA